MAKLASQEATAVWDLLPIVGFGEQASGVNQRQRCPGPVAKLGKGTSQAEMGQDAVSVEEGGAPQAFQCLLRRPGVEVEEPEQQMTLAVQRPGPRQVVGVLPRGLPIATLKERTNALRIGGNWFGGRRGSAGRRRRDHDLRP